MKAKFIIGPERMQLLTKASIPSRHRHRKTVAQPGLDSEYSPPGRGECDGRSRDRWFKPFKIGKSDTTPCTLYYYPKGFSCVRKLFGRYSHCWTMPRTPLLTTKITKDTKVSEMFS